MKYSIVINQRVVADLNDGIEDKTKRIDLIDCALLDWIVSICSSRDARVSNARKDGMTWISYAALLRDMPLLGISDKGAISRRITALTENGYLRRETVGQRTYVDFTVKTERLTYRPEYSTASKPLSVNNGNRKTVVSKQQNRCSTSTDKYTNINNNKKIKIHERARKVKDNLNISGHVRFLAKKEYMMQKDDNQTFEEWFGKNGEKYQTVGG